MGRRAAGEGSIFQGSDGRQHGLVDLGKKPDGTRHRVHRSAKTKKEVADKLAQVRESRAEAAGSPDADVDLTVEEWVEIWLDIVERNYKASTFKTYSTHCRYLLDDVKLRKKPLGSLSTEQVEALYARLAARGVKAVSLKSMHGTLRSCFNEAVKRNRMKSNPVRHARYGRVVEDEVDPLLPDEVEALMRTLSTDVTIRHPIRFVIAIVLGLRQGEVLGLQWDDIDLGQGVMWIKRSLTRKKWKHGCADPDTCPKRACYCPQRTGGGQVPDTTKSKAAVRALPLDDVLLEGFRRHKARQAEERLAALDWNGGPYAGSGWVFTRPDGQPLDEKKDNYEWHPLLDLSGVRSIKLHGARHTAATNFLGEVDPRVVMALFGWSRESMLRRYQHPAEVMKRAAIEAVSKKVVGGYGIR